MMPAAKMLDPLLGIDLHLIQPPAGPPLLVPHPSIGIVFDPFDFIPKFGANVFVNGLPRARAGSLGLMIPHFPIGGVFVVPPANDLEIFMGSKTVSADDEAFSYLALPVLACQSVGMPPIPRPKLKKPKKALGLVLPTAVVLAIPCGVFVEGPPTISLLALAFRAGLGALGKLAKRARNTRPWRALSRRAHNLADKLARKLGLSAAARSRVHRAVCTVTGHPVDVATGKLFTDSVDLELPGPLPLRFERVWYSSSTYRGPLGHGWHHSFDSALYVTPELILLRTPDGRAVAYPPIEEGEHCFDAQERCTLRRGVHGYRLEGPGGVTFEFAQVSTSPLPNTSLHRLHRVSNRVGHRIELRYSEQGLREIVDSAGRSLTFESDREGRLTSLSVPDPERANERLVVVRYAYDELGNLIAVTDALGHVRRYRYAEHLLVQETDRVGHSFYFQFDGRTETARCTRTWGDNGIYDRQISYQAGVTRVVDSLGGVIRYEHANGLVSQSVDEKGAVRQSRYELGRLTEWVDPLGNRTRCSYDERGNPTELVRPDGVKLVTRYDRRGLPVEMRDALGNSWKWRYDEYGQVVERVDPLGNATRYVHERGLLVAIVDALGQRTAFAYDTQGNLVSTTAPDGSSSSFAYNALGWRIRSVDVLGNEQRRTYDPGGYVRRIEDVDGNVREYDYDGEGRPVRVADRWRELRLAYSGTGVLTSRSQAFGTTRFSYDSEERLRAIVNEHDALYSFERDAVGDLVVERGFDGTWRRYSRDLRGRSVRVEWSSGRASDYEYDALDRVVSVRHSDGSESRFQYRADGLLTRAEAAGAVVQFEHDALGQLLRETQGQHWIQSDYDALGNRRGVRTSLGLEQEIERDARGRVSGVRAAMDEATRFEARIARDALGAEVSRSLPGLIQSQWRRDPIGRPLERDVLTAERRLHARAYEWSIGGRLVEASDASRGRVRYAHDTMGRLAGASYDGGHVELRRADAASNLFKTHEGNDRRYGAAGQLLEASAPEGKLATYAHDLDGARIEKHESDGSVWRYRWNARGHLLEVVRPDGATIRFEYDTFGRRIAKHHRNQVTRWLWLDDVPVHEWVEEDGDAKSPVTWLFEPESFAPMARIEDDTAESVIVDPLGTPFALMSATGETTWSALLDTWGNLQVGAGARSHCPFRWPGQYEDQETGLYYNRFRYYDPEAGQYINQDPIGLGGGPALYAYVGDSVTQTDPLGLDANLGNFENLYPEDLPGQPRGLVQLEQREGVWYEVHSSGGSNRARGLYDFVVIDGRVYATSADVGHVTLANHASVQYAGTVRFGQGRTTRGIVSAWDNGSGHFLPHPSWHHQAPFPHELFSAVDFRAHLRADSIPGPQLPIIGQGHRGGCRSG